MLMASDPPTGLRRRVHIQRPAPLRQTVYDAIADMITVRDIQPGEHIVEADLAAELGVSRQPVREALQRLQAEGWVDLRPGHGAFVHVPTDAEADQLLAVRALLEAESARLAARHATPAHIAQLRARQRTGERALADGDTAALVTANAELHAYLLAMSGQRVLAEHIAAVDRRVRWYYSPIARARGRDAWDEHAAVIEAVAAGDAGRAGTLMRRHTERTREAYARRAVDR
jgi:DNA-binding GntR family transcriptional regulator